MTFQTPQNKDNIRNLILDKIFFYDVVLDLAWKEINFHDKKLKQICNGL